MKRLITKLAVAVCTFLIGISATAIWLHKFDPNASHIPPFPIPAASQMTSKETMYSVTLCELIQDSARFDGKVVRLQAFYNQGIDTASLDDSECDALVRPSCASSDESCQKIWERIVRAERSGNTYRVRVDAIGRYTADVVDPNPLQGGAHVHLFEILELTNVSPVAHRR